ncbi:MAG: hypothetical protein SCALA702_35940 [Melioribacteraceae bacterium]|nr:MAG: hypothetical protein SCALA702_35940 [Melioribacteraceae bacterium]
MDIKKIIDNFSGTFTLCDTEGIATYMNKASINFFEKDGGEKLIGTNLLDCHPEPSRSKFENMMKEEKSNVYMIKKKDKTKLVYQAPVYEDGKYTGFMEIMMELPEDIEVQERG